MSISYTLDKRCTEILNIVMYTTGYLKVQDLADDLEVSKRSVYYDISKINEWLVEQYRSYYTRARQRHYST